MPIVERGCIGSLARSSHTRLPSRCRSPWFRSGKSYTRCSGRLPLKSGRGNHPCQSLAAVHRLDTLRAVRLQRPDRVSVHQIRIAGLELRLKNDRHPVVDRFHRVDLHHHHGGVVRRRQESLSLHDFCTQRGMSSAQLRTFSQRPPWGVRGVLYSLKSG